MKQSSSVIQQIDSRVKSGEYINFPLTRNCLVKIRGKLLNRIRLSKADTDTLKAERYFID